MNKKTERDEAPAPEGIARVRVILDAFVAKSPLATRPERKRLRHRVLEELDQVAPFRDRLITVRRLEKAFSGLLSAEAYLQELGDIEQADQIQKIRVDVDRRLAVAEERPPPEDQGEVVGGS